MDLETFIVAVSYTIDEELHELAVQERWRTRGPKPRLADREVLTMEVVGEYLGIDTDQGLSTYFRRHDGAWFPELRRVHRTTFVRQATNLWAIKERMSTDRILQIRAGEVMRAQLPTHRASPQACGAEPVPSMHGLTTRALLHTRDVVDAWATRTNLYCHSHLYGARRHPSRGEASFGLGIEIGLQWPLAHSLQILP